MTPILTIARTRLRLSLRQNTALLPAFAVVFALLIPIWLRGAGSGQTSALLQLVFHAQWFAGFFVPLTMALAARSVDRRIGVSDENSRLPLSLRARRAGEALGIVAASGIPVFALGAVGLVTLLIHHASWVRSYALMQLAIGGLVCLLAGVFARAIVSGGKWTPARMLLTVAALLLPSFSVFVGEPGASHVLAELTGAALVRASSDAVADQLPAVFSLNRTSVSLFTQAALALAALVLPAMPCFERKANPALAHRGPAQVQTTRVRELAANRTPGLPSVVWHLLPPAVRRSPVTAHIRMQMQLVGRGIGGLIVVLMVVGAGFLAATQSALPRIEPSDLVSGVEALLLVLVLPVALSLLLSQRERASGLSSLEPMSPLSSPERRLASSCAVAFFSVVALLVFTGYGTLTWDWAGGRAGVAQEFVAYTCRNVAGICLVSALCSRLLPPASAGRSVALGIAFVSVFALSGLGRELFGPGIRLDEVAAAALVLLVTAVAAICLERESIVSVRPEWLAMLLVGCAAVCLWSYIGYIGRSYVGEDAGRFIGDRYVRLMFATCLASVVLVAFRVDSPQRTAAHAARGARASLGPSDGAALAALVLFGAAFFTFMGFLFALDEFVVAEERWSPDTVNMISLISQLLVLSTIHHLLSAKFAATHPRVPVLAVILFFLVCLGLRAILGRSREMEWLPVVGPIIELINPRRRWWGDESDAMYLWLGLAVSSVVPMYVARLFQRQRPL